MRWFGSRRKHKWEVKEVRHKGQTLYRRTCSRCKQGVEVADLPCPGWR